MSEQKPLCPYCGSTMTLRTSDNRPTVPPANPSYWECAKDWQFVAYYTCECCSMRTGTTIKAPQAHKSSMEAAIIAAYKEAMARPLQKPLTLQDLHALIDAGEEAVVYCEATDDPEVYGNIFYNGKSIDRHAESVDVRLLVYENYGKTWRAWAARPTREERAAALWEG